MMGRLSAQEELFYRFRLEDHVPGDHLLRQIDAVLNFDRVRVALADHYSATGRCAPQKPLQVAICMTPGADSSLCLPLAEELCSTFSIV